MWSTRLRTAAAAATDPTAMPSQVSETPSE